MKYKIFFFTIVLSLCLSCQKTASTKRFELLSADNTHVAFSNTLTPSTAFNIFEYIYYYNGAGVGVGDFNKDGQSDIFFVANQNDNKLYLNRGQMQFEDVTATANVAGAMGWKTGVSVADVNGDGWLDIYVCYYCKYPNGQRTNQLYINKGNNGNGVPVFEEKSAEYGLNIEGYGTQIAFFDADLDGDLDAFLLNHAIKEDRQFPNRVQASAEPHPLAGDKYLINDNGKYKDATLQSGIMSNAIGYGLGLSVGDINMDGWPDIYVGNDFHENDYLYINNKNNTFSEVSQQRMAHTSQFTMGTEIVDINNDAQPDIFSVDMLPDDPKILKTAMGEDGIDLTNYKIKEGYSYQYSRNALQINLGNGYFSEVALQSGIAATDWSWAALVADYDNDGHKDLFVANGIMRRSNDLDYMKFISNTEMQRLIRPGQIQPEGLKMEASLPQVKLNNYFYKNNKDMTFTNVSEDWCTASPSFSNGAAYADFDNDGDLDLVVNNVGDKAFIYKNNSDVLLKNEPIKNHFLNIKLEGNAPNTQGIGAKIWIPNSNGTSILQEQQVVRGYLSSVDYVMHVGLGERNAIDQMYIIWPNGKAQLLTNLNTDKTISLLQKDATITFDYALINKAQKPVFQQVVSNIGLDFIHQENNYNEFDREALIPHSCAAEGPAVAVADVNNDGLEDLFLGNAKWKMAQLYLQNSTGKFTKSKQNDIEQDSVSEDTVAAFFDIDNDGDQDLLVGSGGNEFSTRDAPLAVRLYINENGKFVKNTPRLPNIATNASCIAVADMDGDNDIDVFIGGRSVSRDYGELPNSYLLINNNGTLEDKTSEFAPALSQFGLVTDATWADIDGNKTPDLMLVGEWLAPSVFLNENNHLTNTNIGLELQLGWWNSLQVADMDNDGDLDFVTTNQGQNSKLKPSEKEPVSMYYADFDKNDRKEQLLTYFLHGREYLFSTKDELAKQLPYLNKKYLKYSDFANTDFHDIIGKDKLSKAAYFKANTFSSTYFENDGKGKFVAHILPFMAQVTTQRAVLLRDFDGDGKKDILLAGNFDYNTAQLGRSDAGYSCLLKGDGKGSFAYQTPAQSGLMVSGQTRHIVSVNNKKATQNRLLFVRNNASVLVFEPKKY